jgi:hypothetical protein
MSTKENFIKRNKYKLIGCCIFVFFSFFLAYYVNHVGYKNISNLPGDLKYLMEYHFISLFREEKSPIDYERIQFINDSIEAERSKREQNIHSIAGNFDGTGFTDYAFITPHSGNVAFSKGESPDVTDLDLNPIYDKLFKEGDLDNDGADDFSVYRYKKGIRNEILTYLHSYNAPWVLILTIDLKHDEKISDEDVEARVFRKNNQVYFLDQVKDEKNNTYKLISKSLKQFEIEKDSVEIILK